MPTKSEQAVAAIRELTAEMACLTEERRRLLKARKVLNAEPARGPARFSEEKDRVED